MALGTTGSGDVSEHVEGIESQRPRFRLLSSFSRDGAPINAQEEVRNPHGHQ